VLRTLITIDDCTHPLLPARDHFRPPLNVENTDTGIETKWGFVEVIFLIKLIIPVFDVNFFYQIFTRSIKITYAEKVDGQRGAEEACFAFAAIIK
jgi:hypothetical protein